MIKINLITVYIAYTHVFIDQCFYINIIWALKFLLSRLLTRPIKLESLDVGARHWYFFRLPSNSSQSYGNSWWEACHAYLFIFHLKFMVEFMTMRTAFSWYYLWIGSDFPLASFSTLAIISSKKLEQQLTTDEDWPEPWPHQFKATNVQHNCILKVHTRSE